MAILNLSLNTGRLRSPIVAAGAATKLVTADNLINTMRQLASGGLDPQTLVARVTPLGASGTVTLSSSSGVITATVNGVALATSSLSGTDTENAAALAVVINASVNALVAGIVTATSLAGVVTIAAVDLGVVGNAITLAASGTGATASGARLTGGTNGTSTSYVY